MLFADFKLDIRHVKALQLHYTDTLRNLNCDSSGLLGTLYASNVIDDIQHNKLNKLLATTNAAEELLSMLKRKSAAQFELFLQALRETGQDHVADPLSSTVCSTDIDACLEQYTGEPIIYFGVVYRALCSIVVMSV
jgi:hypothetical protein